MISTELLSEVLDIPISSLRSIKDGNRTIYKGVNINTYELAHKCKEWANKKGYILSSALHNDQGYCEIKKETPERIKSIAWCPVDFNTEVDAIFSACQYILDNQSNIKE